MAGILLRLLEQIDPGQTLIFNEADERMSFQLAIVFSHFYLSFARITEKLSITGISKGSDEA